MTQNSFDSAITDALRNQWADYQRQNPNADPKAGDMAPLWTKWAESARKDIRRQVYQETLADLAAVNAPGIRRRETDEQGNLKSTSIDAEGKPVDTPQDDDLFGEYEADMTGPAHEYAVIRQNLFERGQRMPSWEEFEQNRPGKLMAMIQGAFINSNLAWESGARSIGQWIGRTGVDLAMDDETVAQRIGVDYQDLKRALEPRYMSERFSLPYTPSEEDAELLGKYDQFMLNMYEIRAKEEGDSWMRGARFASEVVSHDVVDVARASMMGTDPANVQDIRDVYGRAQGGALVKGGEMVGSAMGIIPYSVPALASRNPRIAAMLTTPFYAMGHSGAWERRLEIYRDQVAAARANGEPEPARPTLSSLNEQARMAGFIEFGSEYVFDTAQKGLMGLLGFGTKVAGPGKLGANTIKTYANELANSMARRQGRLGTAKATALVAAGGVVEGLEEALPEAAKEITDPLYIPEGYENDFFSEDTAEAVGTGFIAGFITTGTVAGIGAGARRVSRARAEERALAEKAVGAAAGIVQQKADRLAAERLVQNSAQARGATMALHQIEEIGASDRRVMFVSGDVAEATVTEDVKARMEALGIPSKPIGIVHGLRVYAHADQVASVRQDIMDGNIGALTGHPAMKDPNLPAVGAIVVRNQSNQILEVLPYSSEADADSAQPAIQEIASRSGNIVTRASASELPGLSETMAVQMDTDARMRKVARPSRRGPTRQDVARGVQALRLDIANATTRSKWTGARNDAFETEYLTAEEIGGAKNKDVEIDVTLRPVAETQLSDAERRITLASGGRPTIVDGSVRFTITRPDGSKQVFDKPIQQAGAYLAQSSPDGLYLIRENGSAFTARNAMALLLHELRHQLVGRSRAGAKLMAQMMYLDPVLAMRGGIQYMRDYATESTTETDPATNAKRILSDEELVGRYAAMHAAAESVLTDPDASAADREAALKDRTTAEQFAEEMAAVQAEESTGQTLTAAAMWEPIYKNMRGMNARKFASWAGYHLSKAGWAGPWAKQALWELSQRQKGVADAQLRIHDQMLREIEPKYREDMERNRQVLEGSRSQVMPAVGAALGAAAAAPLAGAAGGDDDEIAAAGKALEGIGALPPEQKGEALSKIISALSAVVPTLASASASITGTGPAGRAGVQPGKRQAPAAQPQVGEVVAQPAAAPQPEARPTPMTSTERESMYRQRTQPMFAMRPERKVELFSALAESIRRVPEESMTPKAWSNRIKSMVNKGQVKQAEVDWSGFEDYLALPRDEKTLTRDEVYRVATTNFQIDRIDASPVTLTTDDVRKDVHTVIVRWEEQLSEEMAREQGVPLEDFDLPMEIRRDIKAVYDGRLVPGDADNNAYWEFDSEAENRLDDLAWNLNLPLISGQIGESIDFDAEQDSLAPNYEAYTLPGGTNYRQTVLAVPNDFLSKNPDVSTYESPHWDGISNPIAHIRTKDRVSADGAKVLFVEEVQSDWAKEGRKAGFQSKELPDLPEGTKYFQPGELEVNAAVQIPRPLPGTSERTTWYGRTIEEATGYARRALARAGVPRGPFVQSTDGWLNLTLKDVILEAINGGYDRVAFVNGQQSADRYDLSKKIRGIEYTKRNDGYDVQVWTVDGGGYERLNLPERIAEEDLPNYFGEELSAKMVAGDGTRYKGREETRSLSSGDIRVGGRGMIDFYDKIVPAAVNKLLGRMNAGKATVIDAGTGARQIGFDVTDAMRKSVTDAGGMAMFAMRGKPADPSGGVGRSLAADAIRELDATEEEIKATVLDRMKGGSKQDTFLPEQVGGITSIVRYLSDRRRASGLKKLDVMNPKDHIPLMRLMVLEAVAHIKAAMGALQWYDSTVRSMLAQAALIHPELATDKNAQMVFAIGLAISSQGQNVEDNIAVALSLYDSYKASIDPATGVGQFGDGLTKGTKKASQNKNLKLANTMLREIGLEGMRTFLAKQYTVKELRALGYKPGGELVDEALLGSSVFGPKIGFGFLSNLMGNFDPITMDMWFMRTVLRLAGSLSKFNPKTYAKQRARFLEGVAEIKQAEGPNGIYASDIDPTLVARATAPNARESSVRALAKAVMSAHEKDFKNNRAEYDSGARKQTKMVLAAKTIVGSIDKPRDVAKSGRERHNLRAIVRLAVAETNRITGLKIPHAAFQALIWYPEQELFKSLGAKLKVTSQDYAGAMTKELKKRGISDARINAAIASANPPAPGPDGTGGPRGPRGPRVRPAAGATARPVGRVADRQADGAVRPQDQGQSGERGVESQFSMRRGLRGVRDEAALRYVDKFDELLRYTRLAEERGTTLTGLANPYTAARLLTDRLGAMQRGAERRYADLLRRQYEAGVTLGEMDEFLTAQHAEERNRYVASINPAFPDGGSGMMTSDANDILDDHRNNGRFDLLEGFANEWRAMLNEALVQRRDAGLVTQDLYDRLTTRYQRYVPLRGAPAQIGDEDFEAWGEPGGSGLSTTGRGVPRSMGRRSEAQGVTSQVAYVHEDAFRRIARNQVGQAFLSIVRAVGDRAMAEVIRPRRRVLVNGVVRNVHDMGWMQDPRNFGVYVDQNVTINGHDYEPGDLVVIRINNRRLADAMTSPTLQLRSFERALTNVNNVWRFMTTGMGNPSFAPVNMLRDVGQAVLNNLARRGFVDTVGMMRRWPRAFMRVWMDNWINLEPDQMATAGRDRRLTGSYARFVEAGGDMVGWRGNDLEAKQTDFNALADRVARRDPNDRTLARTLLGWYSGFFAASETAARLAQFEQRVATGSSDYDAALAARDITVDFRKGGMAKPVLNTWYMFLNAGLQGTVNVAGAVARSLTLAPSLIMLGFVQAFMARTMGGDDEATGQAKWDNVPDYEKTSNMFFFDPNGSGKHAKLPVPYGYNVFFSAGVRLEDVIYGRSTPADMASGMLVDALNAFNPIGGSGITGGTGNVLTSIMPTMVRPLGELAINEDFSGRPIYPRSYGKFPQPDSTMFFDGTPQAYISTADWLNRATGGDEFEAGALDMSPDTMEYLVGYYFSGTGRMLNRVYKVATSGGDINPNDVPVIRSFIGDASTDTRAISQQYNAIGAELAPSMRRLEAMEDENLPLETRRRAAMGVTATQQQLVESLKATDKALSEINRLLKGSEGETRKSLLETRRIYQKGLIRRKNELTDALRALE